MLTQLYKPFQHWSEVGTIWVYSDPHFNDPEMVHLRRNYIGDEEQIKRINAKVGKKDTLIILGDIGDPSFLKYVRGKKVLIKGNHDAGDANYEEYFDEIYGGALMIAEKLILTHEPVDLPWAFNIHGHDHSGWFNGKNHLNVCAEWIDYTPVNLTKFIKEGGMSKVETIHRITIDKATKRKEKRK